MIVYPYFNPDPDVTGGKRLTSLHNAVSSVNDLSAEELLIINKSAVDYQPVADPENFGGGGFEAKTSKIRMSSPKLRVIFRPKSEIQTFFLPKIRWSPKKKKKKKKKKRSSPKLRLIFRPDLLRLGRWGGMHLEMEPNYTK